MTSTIIVEPDDVADDGRGAFHTEKLAEILALPAGPERAAAAGIYGAMLAEWSEEAVAIRDVEVWRLRGQGWGPTQIGRALGVHKSRGYQILLKVNGSHVGAQQVVNRLRRRVSASQRTVDLRVVEED